MDNKIPVLSVYDKDGNRIEIPAVAGRSAYAEAVAQGYTGTREEFGREQAEFAANAAKVASDRNAVEQAKSDTEQIKSDALTEVEAEKDATVQAVQDEGAVQIAAVRNAAEAKKNEIAGLDAVQFISQDKTDEEKTQARVNIDAASQKEVDSLSAAKVNLPTNEDGTPNHGTVGYYAVSDGAGGITWVASGNTGGSTGGDGGEETIKTENLKDMAAFCDSTVISGYTATLNDDAETYNVSLGNTTYKDASLETTGGYYAIYFGQVISGGVLHIEFDTALITKLETKILLTNRPITPTFYTAESLNIPKCLTPNTYSATSGDIKINTYDSDEKMNVPSLLLVGSADITIPTGYYPIIFFRKNLSAVVDTTINSNNLFTKYVYDNVNITHEGIAVSSEAEISTVDEDYAMDYGISAAALVTDEASTTKITIDSAYAAVIEEAKNAWMLECNGNIDKIPLVVHTDQHSYYTSSELFDFIAEIVNWYDVGKVINLGDTAGSWVDADTEHPTLSCTALENYLTATASVPFSKRIEVFGNHDTWGDNADGTGRYTPQNYLYKYFRNIYARRADNYGDFVVFDDNYNVKYLAVSGMAYDSELGGYSHYVINPDSLRWIIAELEKADGYDVIILSHVPLGVSSAIVTNPIDGTSETKGVGGVNSKLLTELWTGRKDKTTGTVTDEYGTSYAFDFTSCNGELLCGLHGHVHEDGYYYIGNLLDAYFDCYYQSPKAIHFVIVDRENRRLNVWKVDDTPQYVNYQIPLDKPTE